MERNVMAEAFFAPVARTETPATNTLRNRIERDLTGTPSLAGLGTEYVGKRRAAE